MGYGAARVRDAAYLNWKYCRHSNLSYRIWLAERGGRVAGYLVFRAPSSSDPERRALVPDFLVANGDADALRPLLARAVHEASAEKAVVLSALTTLPWAARLMRALGFLPRGEHHAWVVGGLQGIVPEALRNDAAGWHLCIGDSDGDLWAYP